MRAHGIAPLQSDVESASSISDARVGEPLGMRIDAVIRCEHVTPREDCRSLTWPDVSFL